MPLPSEYDILFRGSPRSTSLFPPMPEQEQDSLLGQVGRGAVGALGYLGSMLDKYTGARAVRGLLGGRPEELMSIIPLSDTFGWTDEANAVSGKRLLENAGVFDRGDDSWTATLAGMGTELLLDPSTYINPFAPVTKAGAIARKAGVLPKGLGSQMRGLSSLAPEAIQAIESTGNVADDVLNKPLRSAFSIGLPGMDKLEIGTGAVPQALLDALGSFGEAATTSRTLGGLPGLGRIPGVRDLPNPVPYARGLFDATAGGTPIVEAQKIYSEQVFPDRLAAEATRKGDVLGLYRDLEGKGIRQDPAMARRINELVEGVAAPMPNDPVADAANQVKQGFGGMVDEATEWGVPLRDFGEVTPGGQQLDYMFRQAVDPGGKAKPHKGGGWRNQKLLATGHAAQIARDPIFANLPRDVVDDMFKDPAVSGANRTLAKPKDAADYILNTYLGGNANFADQAGRLASRLQKADPLHAEQGLGLFTNHPLQDFETRRAWHDNSMAHARGAQTLFSQNVTLGASPGEGFVSAAEALQRAGLVADKGGRGGRQKLAELIQQATGQTIDPKKLETDAWIREDIVDAATKWMRPFVSPESVKPFVTLWDQALNLFKGAVTTAFPSFHVRNAMTGVWQNWVSGAFDPTVAGGKNNPLAYLSPMKDAKAIADGKVVKGLAQAPVFKSMGITDDAAATTQLADWAHQYGLTHADNTQRAGMVGGQFGTTPTSALPGSAEYVAKPDLARWAMPWKWGNETGGLNPLNVRGVTDEVSRFAPIAEGDKAQALTEFVNRTSNFIAKIKQGFTPEQAAAAAKAAHLDYSMLSQFERNVARRVIPWYSFSRRNLPMLLESMAESPGKVTGTVRAANTGRAEEGFLPSYIGEGAAIPLPGAPAGQQRYLSSLGLPVEDEAIGVLASLLSGDLARAGEKTLGMTAPLVKGPLEAIAGKQFFSGRDLSDLKPTQMGSAFGLLSDEYAQPLTQFLSNTPIARAATTVDKLFDDRKGWPETLANLATGFRVTDADVGRAREIEGRKIVEQLLRESGKAKEMVKLYPDREKMGELTPDEIRLFQLYAALQQDARKAAQKQR